MIYYTLYEGRGCDALARDLDNQDPFLMSGDLIVEQVLAMGCVPDTSSPQDEPYDGTDGQAMVVRGDGETEERQTFIVAIDPEAEIIVVQEERAEAYEADHVILEAGQINKW